MIIAFNASKVNGYNEGSNCCQFEKLRGVNKFNVKCKSAQSRGTISLLLNYYVKLKKSFSSRTQWTHFYSSPRAAATRFHPNNYTARFYSRKREREAASLFLFSDVNT